MVAISESHMVDIYRKRVKIGSQAGYRCRRIATVVVDEVDSVSMSFSVELEGSSLLVSTSL